MPHDFFEVRFRRVQPPLFKTLGDCFVSFGMYNIHEDVDALTTALRRILTDLNPTQQSHSSPDIVVAPG